MDYITNFLGNEDGRFTQPVLWEVSRYGVMMVSWWSKIRYVFIKHGIEVFWTCGNDGWEDKVRAEEVWVSKAVEGSASPVPLLIND